MEQVTIGKLLEAFHGEAKGAPVRSAESVATALNMTLGREMWSWEASFMSPHWHRVRVKWWSGGTEPYSQEAWSDQGPDIAALKVYRMLGGLVEIPAPKRLVEEPKAALPAQHTRQTVQHISSSMPQVKYEGPKAWGDDANETINPLHTPEPPEEPAWFQEPMAYWMKNKYPGVTWADAVRIELENPGGRDQPIGSLRWAISKPFKSNDPAKTQQFLVSHDKFMSRAKATLIWHEKALQMRLAGGEGPEGPEYDRTTPF